jgi:secondary thiamine-phosphate synthase enzyme
MRQAHTTFDIRTPGRGLTEITPQVTRWLAGTGITTGLVTLFIRHTSASLLIQENADPEVQRDLERFLTRLVPDGDPLFEHASEGPDDMPAHVRAALTATTLSVPVVDGRMVLGTWQGIYVFEHRRRGQTRQVVGHGAGDGVGDVSG